MILISMYLSGSAVNVMRNVSSDADIVYLGTLGYQYKKSIE
jgi:hypothetical protein